MLGIYLEPFFSFVRCVVAVASSLARSQFTFLYIAVHDKWSLNITYAQISYFNCDIYCYFILTVNKNKKYVLEIFMS